MPSWLATVQQQMHSISHPLQRMEQAQPEQWNLQWKKLVLQPYEVEYINAHGTSTHHNDLFETRAIHKAFGDAAKNLVVNSTKSMIGHLLGAAGGVEFVTCVKSLEEGFVHQTVGTTIRTKSVI